MTTTWDDSFDGVPIDLSRVLLGDDSIRDLKIAIRERLELEHNFATAKSPYHIAGKCSVVYVGTTQQIADLMPLEGLGKGCIAFDITENVFKYFDGALWQEMKLAHGDTFSLTAHDHTQYLRLDATSQTLNKNLTIAKNVLIDGKQINVEGGKLDTLVIKKTSLASLFFDASESTILLPDSAVMPFVIGDVIKSTTPLNTAKMPITSIAGGTITVSATLVEETATGILFVENRRLDKYITPGGPFNIRNLAVQDCFIIARSNDIVGIYTGTYTSLSLRSAGCACWCPVKSGEYWKVNYMLTGKTSPVIISLGKVF